LRAQRRDEFWYELVSRCEPESQIATANAVAAAKLLDYRLASVDAGAQGADDRAIISNARGPEKRIGSRTDILVERRRHQDPLLASCQLPEPGVCHRGQISQNFRQRAPQFPTAYARPHRSIPRLVCQMLHVVRGFSADCEQHISNFRGKLETAPRKLPHEKRPELRGRDRGHLNEPCRLVEGRGIAHEERPEGLPRTAGKEARNS